MGKDNVVELESRVEKESRDALDEFLREGARNMLQAAIEAEVAAYIENRAHLVDPETGYRLVSRSDAWSTAFLGGRPPAG